MITFQDGVMEIKAIDQYLNVFDCLFSSIKQFPSLIQEKFTNAEEIYEVLQNGDHGYELKTNSMGVWIQFKFRN